MTILAVDDEPGSLKLLLEAIDEAIPDHGEILKAQSGEEGLRLATTTKVDLAFLDIRLGDMTGLSLAKEIKKTNPFVNIIFVTGYSEYSMAAISMHASGYITKPVSAEDVKKEYDNLLYPLKVEKNDLLYCKTFGHFEVFSKQQPLVFERSKSKELLAYLVDRQGSSVNRNQLIAILFPDDSSANQNYLTQIWHSLKDSLKSVGCEDVLIKHFNQYALDVTKVKSDLFDYQKGDPVAINSFRGEYMTRYEWAEDSIGKLYKD